MGLVVASVSAAKVGTSFGIAAAAVYGPEFAKAINHRLLPQSFRDAATQFAKQTSGRLFQASRAVKNSVLSGLAQCAQVGKRAFQKLDSCFQFPVASAEATEPKYAAAKLVNGVGNQLFTAAATAAYAYDTGRLPVFTSRGVEHIKGESPILSRLRKDDSIARDPDLPVLKEHQIKKPVEGSVRLSGLFQSPSFFHHHCRRIINLFKPTLEIETQLDEKFGDLLKHDTVAIHVRRGDYLTYKNGPDRVLYDLSGEGGGYYVEALKHFDKENQHFLIFSNDMDFAKSMPAFKDLKHVHFIEGLKPHMDFYLISKCKNQIIANSTFSWWAAYLGYRLKQMVVMPLNWWHKDMIDANKRNAGPNAKKSPYSMAHHNIKVDGWIQVGTQRGGEGFVSVTPSSRQRCEGSETDTFHREYVALADGSVQL